MQFKVDQDFINSIVNYFIGGICAFNIDSKSRSIEPLYFNDGFYRMFSGDKADIDRIFKDIRISIIPDDIPIFEQGIDDILADNGAAEFEFRIVNFDGSLMWLRFHGNLYSREGDSNIVSAVILDCTEEKTIEEELKRQSDYMHLLMDTDITFDFNCRTDVCIYRFTKTDSLEHDSVINGYHDRIPTLGIHEEDLETFTEVIDGAMTHPHRDSLEFRSVGLINPSENYRWYRADVVSILGKEGYVSHVIGHIVDIHESKLKEIELKLRADHDGLTGLMNKQATETLICNTLEQYRQGKDIKGALMILDTDDFKTINDTYGHSAGDRVLSTIGDVIRNNFKGMDVTGRIGGDEFMIFMHNIRRSADAEVMAAKVQDTIRHSFAGQPYENKVSMSIGIVNVPEFGTDFRDLYDKADRALYCVKSNGKAGHRSYSEDM
ncbi:MAG: diguanylate cyclase [Lachnospiraceae bacterium]|nr:diguanylate cyclase [Lachnospiraceae bacterium]